MLHLSGYVMVCSILQFQISVIVIGLIEVFMDVVAASFLGVMNEYPSGGPSPLGHAETAVTDLPTRRTYPLPVPETLGNPLPVPVQQTGATELSPRPSAVLVMAHSFCVDRFLPALVTRGTVHTIVDLV